jgi:hypothetical protein
VVPRSVLDVMTKILQISQLGIYTPLCKYETKKIGLLKTNIRKNNFKNNYNLYLTAFQMKFCYCSYNCLYIIIIVVKLYTAHTLTSSSQSLQSFHAPFSIQNFINLGLKLVTTDKMRIC